MHPTPFATEQFEAEAGTDSPRLEPQGSTAAALEAAVMEHANTNCRESSAEWGQAGLPDSNGSLDHAAAGAGSTFIYPCDELDCSDEEAARVGSSKLRFCSTSACALQYFGSTFGSLSAQVLFQMMP